MGRPKKPDPRHRQLNIRLTASEFDTLHARAMAQGFELVDYGRWILVDNARLSALPTPPEPRFDRLAHVQLQRLGNLLNQLVRHAHQTGEAPTDELVFLLREIRTEITRSLR